MVRRIPIMLLVGLVAFVPVIARGQTTAPASLMDRSALVEQAADEAMQHLYDAIAAISVVADNTTHSMAALLSSSPQVERQVRQAILAQRHIGRSHPVAPGVVAVDVSIESSRVSEVLQAALKNELPAGPKQIRTALTASPIVFATGQAADDGLHRDEHPGWRHCTPSIVTMCKNAAERDLRQHLLAWLLRVQLANGATVSQLARQDPRIGHALRKQMDRITGSEFALEPTGICILTCTVSAEQLTASLRAALAEGELNFSGDLRPAVAIESTMTVQGFSLAPPQPSANIIASRVSIGPDWVGKTLTKTASATAPTEMGDPIARKELAIQAARIEAQRQLWIELEKLAMPDGASLGEHLARRSDRAQLAKAINAAILTLARPSVNDQGTASITLGLPLEAAWQIIGQ